MHAVAVRDSPKLGGWGGTRPEAFVGSPKLMNSNSPNGRESNCGTLPCLPSTALRVDVSKEIFHSKTKQRNNNNKQNKKTQKTNPKAFCVYQYTTNKREISGKH